MPFLSNYWLRPNETDAGSWHCRSVPTAAGQLIRRGTFGALACVQRSVAAEDPASAKLSRRLDAADQVQIMPVDSELKGTCSPSVHLVSVNRDANAPVGPYDGAGWSRSDTREVSACG